MAYSVFIHNVTFIYYAIISRVKCVECAHVTRLTEQDQDGTS